MSQISDVEFDINIKEELDSSMYYSQIKNSSGKENLFPRFDDNPFDLSDKEGEDKFNEEMGSYLNRSDDENSSHLSLELHPYQNKTTFLTHEMLKENQIFAKTSDDNKTLSASQLNNFFQTAQQRSGNESFNYRNSGDCLDVFLKGSQTQKDSEHSGYTNDSESIPYQGSIYNKGFSSQDKKYFQELGPFTLAKSSNAEEFRVPLKSIPNFQTKSLEEGDNLERMKTLDDNCSTSWPFSQSQPTSTKHIPNFNLKPLKPSSKINENSILNKKRPLIKPSFKPVFKRPQKNNENITIETAGRDFNTHNIKFSPIIVPDNETNKSNKNMNFEGTKSNELNKEHDHSNAVEKSVNKHQDLDINFLVPPKLSFTHGADTNPDIEDVMHEIQADNVMHEIQADNVMPEIQAENVKTKVQEEKMQLPINKSIKVQKFSANKKSVDTNADKSKVHKKYEKFEENCKSADIYQSSFKNKYSYLYPKSKCNNEVLIHNKLAKDGNDRVYRRKINKEKRTNKLYELKTKETESDIDTELKLNESIYHEMNESIYHEMNESIYHEMNESISNEMIKVEVCSDNEDSGSEIDSNDNMHMKENSCNNLAQFTLKLMCENIINSGGFKGHHLNVAVHTEEMSGVTSRTKASKKLYEAPTHNQDKNQLRTNEFKREIMNLLSPYKEKDITEEVINHAKISVFISTLLDRW